MFTPYAATKLVNEWLAQDGLDKTLPGPMIYNYTKKGYIPSKDGKIEEGDLKVWYVKYITKKGIKTSVEV